MSLFVGVDIGASCVDVVSVGDGKFSKPKQYKQYKQYKQSPDGHNSLVSAST